MPSYSYTAINDAGIKKKGILSADSEREARKLVKDLKLTPLKISESKNLDKTLRIKNEDIVLMTRQLATLLEASTPIVDSIDITARQTKNKKGPFDITRDPAIKRKLVIIQCQKMAIN